MRVVVNGLPALKPKTGVGHYTASVLAEFQHASAFPDGRLREWVARSYRVVAGASKPPGASKSTLLCSLVKRSSPLLRDVGNFALGRAFRAMCARERFDLYHEPNFIPFACDLPTVTTIHDLSVLAHPEWHPADRVRAWEKQFLAGVGRSAHFVAVSEAARQEVLRVLGVSPSRVTAVHNGIRESLCPQSPAAVAAVREALRLPDRFLLHVGTIEPRKNLLMLMRAFVALPATLRERCPLVLVGGWGWNTAEVADYFHSTARSAGVRHVGYAADGDLAALYTAARALVYPSLYEGFGLPPLEMMACGGAAVASDIAPHREVAGGQALLIDPRDEIAWRDAIAGLIADDDMVRSLRNGAERHARPFTWARCAAETRAVFRKVLHPWATTAVAA